MKTALEILGIPTYHGFTVFSNPPDAQMWSEGLDAKLDTPLHSLYSSSPKPPRPAPFTRKDWDSLLGHVSAVSDAPAAIFGPELIEAYPEAKIVLVKRNSEAWFRSYDEAIIQTRFNKLYEYASWLDTKLGRPLLETLDKTLVGYFGAKELTIEEVRRAAKEGYERHYEIIRQAAPKERLLEYKLGSGWGPLCEFLEVEEPEGVEFPRVNEAQAFRELLRGLFLACVWRNVKAYGWMVALAGAIGVMWKTF